MFKGLIAVLLVASPIAFGDDLLGSVRLTSFYGSERTAVTKCSRGDVAGFSDIKIEVLFGHAYVDDIEFEFADGTTENIYIDGILTEGTRTDWIEVSEEENCIVKISVRGNGVGRVPRSTLQFFGR